LSGIAADAPFGGPLGIDTITDGMARSFESFERGVVDLLFESGVVELLFESGVVDLLFERGVVDLLFERGVVVRLDFLSDFVLRLECCLVDSASACRPTDFVMDSVDCTFIEACGDELSF